MGYQTQSIDTSFDAETYLFGRLKSLTLIQKAEKVSSWTKGCLELSLVGLKQRYLNVSQSKLKYEFAKATLKSNFSDIVYQNISDCDRPLMLNDPISQPST